MTDKTKVVVAVRVDFERQHWVHPGLVCWLLSLPYETTYKMCVEIVQGAGGTAPSANRAAYVFMDKHPDAEWLCIADNDTVPPMDILRILDGADDEVSVVSPVTHMARDERAFPMQGLYDKEVPGRLHCIDPTVPGLWEVDRAGGGCAFYRRRVFAAMERPYFKTLYDDQTQMAVMSDDVYCQENAKKHGFRLYCDTRFIASHYHTRDLSD